MEQILYFPSARDNQENGIEPDGECSPGLRSEPLTRAAIVVNNKTAYWGNVVLIKLHRE